MHDVDRPASGHPVPDDLGGGTGERREAHRVVRIVLASLAVDPRPVEEPRNVDDHEVHLGRQAPVEHSGFDRLPSQVEAQGRQPSGKQQALGLEVGKPRHDDGHGVTQGTKGLGQRGGDVGQAAHLDEGPQLGRDESDLHRQGRAFTTTPVCVRRGRSP